MLRSSKTVWAGALTAGVVAILGAVIVTAPSATAKGPTPAAKIKMTFAGGPPLFEGPATVEPGQDLKIVNKTKVKDIGPHFFTLAEEGSLPATKKENKACAKLEFPLCANVVNAHNLSKKFVVRKRSVDKGADGWDTSFSDDVKGDSWFSDEKNESETRAVNAEVAGTTLTYFCLIHPDTMRDTIEVGDLTR